MKAPSRSAGRFASQRSQLCFIASMAAIVARKRHSRNSLYLS
jgi:hypothetical protein